MESKLKEIYSESETPSLQIPLVDDVKSHEGSSREEDENMPIPDDLLNVAIGARSTVADIQKNIKCLKQLVRELKQQNEVAIGTRSTAADIQSTFESLIQYVHELEQQNEDGRKQLLELKIHGEQIIKDKEEQHEKEMNRMKKDLEILQSQLHSTMINNKSYAKKMRPPDPGEDQVEHSSEDDGLPDQSDVIPLSVEPNSNSDDKASDDAHTTVERECSSGIQQPDSSCFDVEGAETVFSGDSFTSYEDNPPGTAKDVTPRPLRITKLDYITPLAFPSIVEACGVTFAFILCLIIHYVYGRKRCAKIISRSYLKSPAVAAVKFLLPFINNSLCDYLFIPMSFLLYPHILEFIFILQCMTVLALFIALVLIHLQYSPDGKAHLLAPLFYICVIAILEIVMRYLGKITELTVTVIIYILMVEYMLPVLERVICWIIEDRKLFLESVISSSTAAERND